MASGARWGSPELSWADSCLIDDGTADAQNWTPQDDFGARNAHPAWIPVPCEESLGFPIPAISPFRETFSQGKANDVFAAWNWNPLDSDEDCAVSFSLVDAEDESLNNIFQTWDLNTQSLRAVDDDLLEFLAWTVAHSGEEDGSPSTDGSDPPPPPPPAVDVFDLNALSSTLEEEELGFESLIAGMADLNISV